MRKENIDRFFDYGIHTDARTIYVGDIDQDASANVIKAMRLFNSNPQPITILLNSFGGCWYNGMAIYDAIHDSPCHVTMEVLGSAMSMGAVILQAADDRVIHPHATLMIHDGLESRENDTPRTFEAWAVESKRNRQTMYRILADRTGKTVRYWERKCGSDYLLDATEALAEGLVDQVVETT